MREEGVRSADKEIMGEKWEGEGECGVCVCMCVCFRLNCQLQDRS